MYLISLPRAWRVKETGEGGIFPAHYLASRIIQLKPASKQSMIDQGNLTELILQGPSPLPFPDPSDKPGTFTIYTARTLSEIAAELQGAP